jgi:hypothetical protein
MADRVPENKERGILLKVLTAHFRELVAAKSDGNVLRQYSALLRFLKSGKADFLEAAAHTDQRVGASRRLPSISEEELRRASLDDIARLVSDEATPRKDLEFIAIERFSVPRGSMRSFSNRRMLVEKLLTLIANERTHETISAVARGQAKGNGD